MKNRYINWQGIRDLTINIVGHLLMLGFCFVAPWGVGHIPFYRWLGLNPPVTILVHWAHGFLYCLIWTAFLAVLYVICYGSCMAFGWLFPEKETRAK